MLQSAIRSTLLISDFLSARAEVRETVTYSLSLFPLHYLFLFIMYKKKPFNNIFTLNVHPFPQFTHTQIKNAYKNRWVEIHFPANPTFPFAVSKSKAFHC